MNHIYRLVWNRALRQSQVASELAHSAQGGQTGGKMAACRPHRLAQACAVALCLSPLLAWGAAPVAIHASLAPLQVATGTTRPAPLRVTPNPGATVSPTTVSPATIHPSGGQVTAGSGAISQSGLTTTIDQYSQNLSLNWLTFNIGADSTVNFLQPNAQSIAVNRIADPNGSVILGHLNANGQVFLINPNGVLFGQGAQINVGGLVASTLDVSDSELGSATLHWRGDSQASVINQGTLHADGGYAALVAAQVINNGTLAANGGSVALGAGNAITLSFDGSRLLGMRVDKSTLAALAENKQLIVADGGQVLMSAGAKDALLASTVNNTGTIQARTVENRAGKVVLLGGMQAGTTHVTGTLDASAPNGGNGGFVETSAAQVKITDDARITTRASDGRTGTWLIDPNDYTVAASGGDISGATLSTNLAGTSVSILSSDGSTAGGGNININDTVSWGANTLTLTAANDININAVMTASGSAGLALNPATANGADTDVAGGTVNVMPGGRVDFTGASNALSMSGTAYTIITSLGTGTSATPTDLQGINKDLAGHYALGANIDASTTNVWNSYAGFTPLGNDTARFTGIFDGLGHTISGLSINRGAIDYVGLFGYADAGSAIRNVGLLDGSITGKSSVGGLVGRNEGRITSSYATASVSGNGNVGGLVGHNSGSGTIASSHASGAVNGSGSVGGLAGQNSGGGAIASSHATGAVHGSGDTGGLVGFNDGSSIASSYATGAVEGGSTTGGLAGFNGNGSSITLSYATGMVSGTGLSAGGLVGENLAGASIASSYATGAVTGTTQVGGLVGYNNSSITGSFWDSFSTGQAVGIGGGTVAGASAITSDPGQSGAIDDAFTQSAYAGFDFARDWFMVEGNTRPFLRGEYSTSIGNAHQLQLMAMNLGAQYALAADIDASETARAVDSPTPADAAGMWSHAGFSPVGDYLGADSARRFVGIFDGLGHTISGLTINRPVTDYVGLFGFTDAGSVVRGVGLRGGSVTGRSQVGGLAGENAGTISQAYASSAVIAVDSISNAVGGLVGANDGEIEQAYAMGAISGASNVGGLVGFNADSGVISRAYAAGAVGGDNAIGGLVGFNRGDIDQTYATGAVSGAIDAGGLVGYNLGTAPNNYWNTETTGQATSAGVATGLTTAQMFDTTNLAGFDFAAVWGNGDNQTTPYLLGMAGSQVFNVNDLPTGPITPVDRPNFYTVILDVNQLQAVNADLAGRYVLGDAIDASATAGWNSGAGFVPLTRYVTVPDNGPMCPPMCTQTQTFPFTGIFDGLGYAISNLTINRPTENDLGLFGVIQSGAVVRNLGLIGGSISGMYQIGGLAGENGGTISHSYATANINGRSSVGGLVGSNGGTISGSYATGNINDIAYVDVGVISSIGGLVGFNNSIIDSSYSTGNVNGTNYMGGLVGSNEPGGMIGNSYATGNVVGDYNYRGNYYNGGLVGFNTAQISTSYASGGVIDNGANGGLVGYSAGGGTVTNSYWNSSANTKGFGTNNNGASATSLTIGQMMDPTSFAAWGVDISAAGGSTAVWRIYAGHTAPLLRAFMTDLAVTATDVSATYNGTAFVGSSGLTFGSLVPSHWLPSTSVDPSLVLGSTSAPVSAVNAGSYALGGDVYSSQMGYDLAFTGGTLTITPAPLTVTSSDVSKTYDGGLGAAGSAVISGGTLFGGDTLGGGNFAFTDKNAGTGKTVTVTGITVNDGHGGNNYAITYADNTASTITPLAITVDATGASKVYDGTNFGIVTLTGNGVLAGDAVSFTGNGLFADKNVGTGKTVTIDGITASGADAGNYSFTALPATTADITPLAITVDATADDKVYDATTDATVALNTSGILAGDMVSFTGIGHFEDKNTGTGKVVTIDGITASGADAGNYRFTAPPATTADITPLAITVDATADDKVYDATTDATIALGSAGILAGDSVAFTGTGSFDDRHAGVGKTVTVDDIAASGVDAGNYAYNTTATDTADITPATLTYLADPASAWRGQMPAVLGGTVTGLLGDDTLASATEGTLTWTTSAATSSPAGTYAVNGGGLSAQDYVFVQAPGNAAALHVANGSAPQGVVSVVAGLQQSEDSKAPRAPYAPDVRIINGGVRLP